jgi:hypothetical protein
MAVARVWWPPHAALGGAGWLASELPLHDTDISESSCRSARVGAARQQSHMSWMSTLLCELFPELSYALITNVFVPFWVA